MISSFLSGLDAQLLAWVQQLNYTLSYSWLGTGLFRTIVAVFVVVFGYRVLMGYSQAPIQESTRKFLLLVVIAVCVMYPYFVIMGVLYPFFGQEPFNLAAMLPNAPTSWGGWGGTISGSAIYSRLDDILESAFVTAGGMMTDGDGWVMPTIHGLIIMVSTILAVGYAAFLIIMAKFAIALLVGLSPIFLICLLFDTTKGLFERWLGLLFNYALVPIFTLAILSFGTQWMTRQLNNLTAGGPDPAMSDVAAYALAAVILFLLLLQVMQICASIGGGLALSTMGVAGAAFNGARGQIARVGAFANQQRAKREGARRERSTTDRQAQTAAWQASVSNALNRMSRGGRRV